jgi:hypothetical protein
MVLKKKLSLMDISAKTIFFTGLQGSLLLMLIFQRELLLVQHEMSLNEVRDSNKMSLKNISI